MSDKVAKLQKDLEAAMSEIKKKKGFRLRDFTKPGSKMYKGQGAFRAQAIARIKALMQETHTEDA